MPNEIYGGLASGRPFGGGRPSCEAAVIPRSPLRHGGDAAAPTAGVCIAALCEPAGARVGQNASCRVLIAASPCRRTRHSNGSAAPGAARSGGCSTSLAESGTRVSAALVHDSAASSSKTAVGVFPPGCVVSAAGVRCAEVPVMRPDADHDRPSASHGKRSARDPGRPGARTTAMDNCRSSSTSSGAT